MVKATLLRAMLLVLVMLLAGHFIADVACQPGDVPASAPCRAGSQTSASTGDLASGHLHAGVTLPVSIDLIVPFGFSFALRAVGYTRLAWTLPPPIHPPISIHPA